MLKRREFIALLGGTALATHPRNAPAQSLPVIGFLNASSNSGYELMVKAFHDGLNTGGYVEGQNVAIEYRWADGRYDRLPEMAAEFVARGVTVIVANTPANLAAKQVTSTIPIVFTTASDPVQIGLVSNLSRPGGNVTGVTQLNASLGPKRLELAHELLPAATRIAFLVNPNDRARAEKMRDDVQSAAANLGLKIDLLRAGTREEIIDVFSNFARLGDGAMVIGADTFFNANSRMLAELALRYSVPAIYEYTEFVDAGGLMSYSGNIRESYRWAGIYVARILKGAKPAELPVQQSTTVELVVNLKTAKEIGVTVPLSLLGRADRIVE